MPLKINYSKKTLNKSSSNIVLFANEKFNINSLKKILSVSEFSYINDLLKSSDLKKNILVFEVNSKKKIILVSIKNNLKTSDIESLGAEFYERINHGKNSEFFINTDTVTSKERNFTSHFLHGLKLKSYEFKKYKTKNTRLISINIIGNKNKPSTKIRLNLKL